MSTTPDNDHMTGDDKAGGQKVPTSPEPSAVTTEEAVGQSSAPAAKKRQAKKEKAIAVTPPHAELYAGELALLAATRAMAGTLSLPTPNLIFATDEVGRGCLAGEVVTGVSLWAHFPPGIENPFSELAAAQDDLIAQVRDSKKLTEKSRERLFGGLYSLALPFPREAQTESVPAAEGGAESAETPPRLKIVPPTSQPGGQVARPSEYIHGKRLLRLDEETSFLRPSSDFFGSPTAHRGFVRDQGEKARGLAPDGFVKDAGGSLLFLGMFVTSASAAEIDELGIWVATNLSMNRGLLLAADFARRALAIESLDEVASSALVLVDGNQDLRFPSSFIPAFEAVVTKGDLRLKSIGAASVAAKVARDDQMAHLAKLYPGYGLDQHAGYGTPAHYAALKELGPSPIHRKSFRLV